MLDQEQLPQKPAGQRWLRVLVYYTLALGVAAAARFRWHANDVSAHWPRLGTLLWHLVSGLGPCLGALVVWATLRPPRRLSLGGTYPPLAWAMGLVPALTLGLVGVRNPYTLESHLFGGFIGLWIMAYALLEETGWRGYLQQEFSDYPRLVRYVLVALFWYPWHFTFLQGHSLTAELLIFSMFVAASLLLGWLADRTISILVAACFHATANILGLTAYFTLFLPSPAARWQVVGVCLVGWVVLLRIWRRRVR